MNEEIDGILNPASSETFTKSHDLEAFDRWATHQDDPAAFDALMTALGPAPAPADLAAARRELVDAPPETREKARTKLRDLVAARRPLNIVTWKTTTPPPDAAVSRARRRAS